MLDLQYVGLTIRSVNFGFAAEFFRKLSVQLLFVKNEGDDVQRWRARSWQWLAVWGDYCGCCCFFCSRACE